MSDRRPPAPPDDPAVDAFWSAFCAATGSMGDPADVFAFGDTAAMADELGALVTAGPKRATAGSAAEHEADGTTPHRGDLSVVCDGSGRPIAVIRTDEVTVGPISTVTEAFAWDEGEGDRTRDGWLSGHRAYFRRTCERRGLPYDDDLPVVFERFTVVWPRPDQPATPA